MTDSRQSENSLEIQHDTNSSPTLYRPRTLAFGDLSVGLQFPSVGRTVTEADIMAFAGISGDYNQLHTNELWVTENTSFKSRVAHGLLVLSMSSGMSTPGYDDLNIQAYLSVQRDMTGPVYPGDTITILNTISEMRPSKSRPGNGIVTVAVEVHNQHGTKIQNGFDVLLVGPSR